MSAFIDSKAHRQTGGAAYAAVCPTSRLPRCPAACSAAVLPQSYKRTVRDLEHETAALRAELERKDEQLTAVGARYRESQKQAAELQQELESNAGAPMHG